MIFANQCMIIFYEILSTREAREPRVRRMALTPRTTKGKTDNVYRVGGLLVYWFTASDLLHLQLGHRLCLLNV
jgi:hypothetical protein